MVNALQQGTVWCEVYTAIPVDEFFKVVERQSGPNIRGMKTWGEPLRT